MKKYILGAFLTFALALTLLPGTVAAAETANDGGEYAVTNVSAEGAFVNVDVTAADDCALFVGLYEESGKMTAVRSLNATKTTSGAFSVAFDGAIGADIHAKAFLLNPDTLAPLCESRDSREDEFHADEYALIERITIEDRNGRYVSSLLRGAAPSSPAAVIRLSDGSRRTIALEETKYYRSEDGFAIAPAFWAGRIVRFDGNRLYALDNEHVFSCANARLEYGFVSSDGGNVLTPIIRDADGNRVAGGESLVTDSETHFVVEDFENDTYTAYVGRRNAPDIRGNGAIAYVYHLGALAKLIFVTNATDVVIREPSSPVGDKVTFLAAPSVSNRVSSDIGDYYEVNAVVNGEIKTVAVKDGVSFSATRSEFTPGADGQNTALRCVILNEVTYDSNDLIVAGTFSFDTYSTGCAQCAQGVRYVNERELRLNAFWSNSYSYLRDLSENAKAYFVNQSGDIQRITFADMLSNAEAYDRDFVYYVEDDGQITDLFIVDYTPSAA